MWIGSRHDAGARDGPEGRGIKAFLLAAGKGRRLRPITDVTPKCMLVIDGRPLLGIWLDAFARAGVTEVMVNLHHLPDVVRRHIAAHRERPMVRMVYEPELLVSAGTLLANRHWVADEECFLVCNSDNLTNFDLRSLINTRTGHAGIVTLAVFHSPDPSSGGVAETDETGCVIGFTEKLSRPVSDLTNAGMYVFYPEVLNKINTGPPCDIGYDLLPRLVGCAWTVLVDGYFRGIGTVETYRLALQEWPVRGADQWLQGLSWRRTARDPSLCPGLRVA